MIGLFYKEASKYPLMVIKENYTAQQQMKCKDFALRFENIFSRERMFASKHTNITELFSEVG